MSIDLTDDQKMALVELERFCSKSDTRKTLTLSGYAGTGKTTLMRYLATSTDRRIALTATTNKAVAVLNGVCPGQKTMTIHRLLGLGLSSDSETQKAKEMGNGSVENFEIVIVDEASMVSKDIFDMILRASDRYGVKFLFVGDPLQLPPVGELKSLAFDVSGPTLTKIVRQASDNPIIKLTQDVRGAILGGPMPSLDRYNKRVFPVDYQTFSKWIRESFGDRINKKNHNNLRVLSWRNKTVNRYNNISREAMFGHPLPRFVTGERLIAAKPVWAIGIDGYKRMALSTDSEATVESILETRDDELPRYRVYKLRLVDDDGRNIHAKVIHDSSRDVLNCELQKIADEAKTTRYLWHAFYALRDSFDDLRPCHSLTVHRSQGSTYENVMVDSQDILSNWNRSESLRCLYVAYSRAARNLVVY